MVGDASAHTPVRKQYRKPEIFRVNLIAQEAVLAGCKFFIQPGPGPQPPMCSNPGTGSCLSVGS